MKKIAIVTVNYNGAEDTIEFLDSLSHLPSTNYQLQTIVVDNGSADDSVTQILKKHPNIDLLQTGVNTGFSGGYNRGIEHALIWGADFVLIANNDTTLADPNFLQTMLKTFEDNPKAGIVAPKIYFSGGSEFHKDRYQKEDEGKVIWFAGGSFDWKNVFVIHRGIDEVDTGKYDQIEKMQFLTGCCLLIKREVLEKVGLFNDTYFAYWEDADLSQRIKNTGFDLMYNGQTFIYHQGSKTLGTGSSILDYYMTRNRAYFANMYAGKRAKFAVFRESIRLLLTGQPAQKQAIRDYFQGKTGPREPQKTSNPGYQIKLSVVSVNYNTPDLINNLLKSIYNQDSGYKDQPTEVIILDNGSDKGCENEVKKFPEARFLQNEVNTGFTGGYNKVMKYARGEYILMLNSDIESQEKSLKISVDEAEQYQGQAVTSGALFFPDGTLQDSVFYLPTIWGAIKEYFLRIKGSFFMYTPSQTKNTRVEAAAMACFTIPRKILNRVGFLNEELFTYFEDVDFCRRCKKMGIPIYYTPKAKFIHHHGATGKTMKEGRAYQMLVRASKIYHGEFYYKLLYITLLLAQKFSRTQTPVAR